MYTTRSDMTKINVIRLILLRHEHQENTRNQLNLFHRRDTHVEKDTVEHGHGDQCQELRQKDRKANAKKDDEPGDTLLANAEKFRFLARCGRFRFEFQRDDVIDRKNRCCHKPWKTQYRVNSNAYGHNQQIQMITTAFLQSTKNNPWTHVRRSRRFYLEFVFLAIDNDRRDLLIHEDQNRGQ